MAMDRKYIGLSDEKFELMNKRYAQFQDVCNDTTKDPVKVFAPLSKKSLDELLLIREISKELQEKKEEDIKKAAQAAQVTKEPEEQKAIEEQKESEQPTEKQNV